MTSRWLRAAPLPASSVVRDRFRVGLVFRGLSATAMAIGIGCAHGAWHPLPPLPGDAVVLPVAGRVQQGNRCGSNALAILLAAAGDPVPEAEIARAVQNPRLDGALNLDLVLYARSRGFPAVFESGSLEELLSELGRGIPCLLMLTLDHPALWPPGRKREAGHYVVAYGFSASRKFVLVHSGSGPKAMSLDELAAAWQPTGFWMMHLGIAMAPPATRSPGEPGRGDS